MKRIFALAGFALALSPVQAQQAPAEADAEAGAADAAELAPLTVTADPFADRSPVESTQPAEVLGHEALERARAQTLGESLDGLPGVRSADFGAGSSRPVIRGQGGPRVRVLDGGASVADASTISPDHNVAVEPFRAQQIEVLKGPATLLYGSGAIGGVPPAGRLPWITRDAERYGAHASSSAGGGRPMNRIARSSVARASEK